METQSNQPSPLEGWGGIFYMMHNKRSDQFQSDIRETSLKR